MSRSLLFLVTGADPSLGRLDYESMSQQALMEMVVGGLSEFNQRPLKDPDGNFLELSQ